MCLELTVEFSAGEAVAPLLAAGPAEQHRRWADLIAVAVLAAGGQELGRSPRRCEVETIDVYAILDYRRDPLWIQEHLGGMGS